MNIICSLNCMHCMCFLSDINKDTCFMFNISLYFHSEEKKAKDRNNLWETLDRLKLEYDSKAMPQK